MTGMMTPSIVEVLATLFEDAKRTTNTERRPQYVLKEFQDRVVHFVREELDRAPKCLTESDAARDFTLEACRIVYREPTMFSSSTKEQNSKLDELRAHLRTLEESVFNRRSETEVKEDEEEDDRSERGDGAFVAPPVDPVRLDDGEREEEKKEDEETTSVEDFRDCGGTELDDEKDDKKEGGNREKDGCDEETNSVEDFRDRGGIDQDDEKDDKKEEGNHETDEDDDPEYRETREDVKRCNDEEDDEDEVEDADVFGSSSSPCSDGIILEEEEEEEDEDEKDNADREEERRIREAMRMLATHTDRSGEAAEEEDDDVENEEEKDVKIVHLDSKTDAPPVTAHRRVNKHSRSL